MLRALIFGLTALALTACESLTAEEETAFRDGVVEVAVTMIAEANAEDINPVEMDESDLRIVYFACTAAEAFAPFVDAYIEARHVDDPEFQPIDFKGYVAAACAVARELIQPAAPDEAPVPEPET